MLKNESYISIYLCIFRKHTSNQMPCARNIIKYTIKQVKPYKWSVQLTYKPTPPKYNYGVFKSGDNILVITLAGFPFHIPPKTKTHNFPTQFDCEVFMHQIGNGLCLKCSDATKCPCQ